MSFNYKIEIISKLNVIELRGKLLSDLDIEVLKKEVENFDNHKVIVDLSDLSHLNSTGIAFLISLLTKSRTCNGDTVLVNPNKDIVRIIEISRLNQIFSIYDSLDEGINHYK